ncbi:MAG: hypothetical protein R3B06_00465 [Kofleriaceae bacterium]
MRAAVVSSFLILVASAPAVAQPAAPADAPMPAPVVRMVTPTGWTSDPAAAQRVAAAAGNDSGFDVPVSVDAQVWLAPTPGIALIAVQVATDALPADPDAAATAVLLGARAGADAVAGATVDAWAVTVDPAGRVHQATLEWHDPGVGTTTVARTLVFRTGDVVVRATAECVIGAGGAANRPLCEAALTSITPAASDLAAIQLRTAGTPTPAPPAAAPGDAPGDAPAPPRAGPTLPSFRDGGDLPATIAVRPPASKPDRRPLMLLAGVAVLALVFWFNRRERERREAAERAEARRTARRADRRAGAAPADDAEADDPAADDAAEAIADAHEAAADEAAEAAADRKEDA